jgi:multiple sugar transport system ATP-binding protein
MSSVRLTNLSKVYPGGVRAVQELDLAIADEQFAVVVGPSGCGKTTILRLVSGLESVTNGTISIGGRVMNDVPPKGRDVAMVFQRDALYPEMSVYQNMAFGLRLRKTPKREIDHRVREAARALGLEELLSRKPGALSGGQRRRVAVGRAIVREPACFLMDEPLSNLDAQLRLEMRAELKRLHHRLLTTTIYVTHDQEEAMTLGDQVAVLSEGRLQQHAAPLNIFNNPANRFVAGFIGSPSMNFLSGVLTASDTGPVFEGDGVTIPLASNQRAALLAYLGNPVVCGLRPEALSLYADGRSHAIDVVVHAIEPLGSTMNLHGVTSAGAAIVARASQHPFAVPLRATLWIDAQKVHIFAPGPYGRNLLNTH